MLELYEEWTKEELPSNYFSEIIRVGEQFGIFCYEPKAKYVLDIGSGNGIYGGKPQKEIGYKYHLYPDIIESDVLDNPYAKQFVKMDARNILFRDELFDVIICATSLDHIPDLDKVFSEVKRSLKKEGHFYIWVWVFNKETKPNEHHIWSFTEENIMPRLKNYFTVERVKKVSSKNDSGNHYFIKVKK